MDVTGSEFEPAVAPPVPEPDPALPPPVPQLVLAVDPVVPASPPPPPGVDGQPLTTEDPSY